jgi:hypothetical protein
MKKSLRLNIKPNPDDIEMATSKSVNFLKSRGLSDRTIKAQTMILRELIEKGKSFTNSKNTENEMTIHLHIEERKITVVLKKSVDESAHRRLEELDKTIQWIRGHQDPFEPYLIKHREAFDKHPKSELNGFGLAKIAYKADAIVDFYVSEDNILNLTAARSLNGDVIS